jgi:WD40 repeat protein
MPDGTFLGCLAGHKEPVSAVVFTREGPLVSADQGGLLIFWDSQSRQEIGRLQLDETVYALAASPDGRRLAAASGDGTILLLDLSWKTAARNLAGRELTSQECETWIHSDPRPPACTQKR